MYSTLQHSVVRLFLTVGVSILALGVSIPQTHAQNTLESLPERINEIQRVRGVYDLDLYTNIHSRVIMRTLEESCSSESLLRAQNFIDQADAIITRDYMTLRESVMLEKSLDLYETVKSLSRFRVDGGYTGERYCTLKYAMTGLMQLVRDKHINTLKVTGLYNDFENVRAELPLSGEIYGLDVKIDTLRTMQNSLQLSALQLPVELNVKEINPEFFDSLNDDERALMREISSVVKLSSAATLQGLYRDGILSYNDLDALSDVIQFKYTGQCGRLHGEYSVQLVTDRSGNPRNSQGNFIEATPQTLTLTVNLCDSYFVIKELGEKFETMIVHEIAHHLYYTRDQSVLAFENICRLDEGTRSAACGDAEFISSYAQTNAAEDYAEHFVARWKATETDNPVVQRKINHFKSQYGER